MKCTCIALAIYLLALTGCATTPELVTGPQTVRVEVPIRVKCISMSDLPQYPAPTPVDVATATREQVAAAVAADLLAIEDYAKRADVALRACAGATP